VTSALATPAATAPRLRDRLRTLVEALPLPAIQQALAQTGRQSQRQRRLPAHVMVYYIVGLALFMDAPYREVLRHLRGIWAELLGESKDLPLPSKSGVSQARERLGAEPLKRLYETLVHPVAVPQTRGARYRNWRLVSLDGSTLDVADTAQNDKAFGRPGASRGQSSFPKVRFVALAENATHVLFAARLGAYREGETTLARDVFKALEPGMLCLADRNFFGYAAWKEATATGADLLWRAKTGLLLPCEERLADGSYLARVYPSPEHRRRDQDGILIRVIEYELTGVSGAEPLYRLITTVLDPQTAPAEELAALYHERWEFENTLDELKTHLRGRQVVLRSKTPELVRQEFYGLMLAHWAIRGLMHEAALHADVDPDTLSFLHTVRVVRRLLPLGQEFFLAALAVPA
jgi:hypothetical protein